VLGEGFKQIEMAAGQYFFEVADDVGVVQRIRNIVTLACKTIGQADIKVDLQGLWHQPLPVIDADECVDLEFAQKDDVHCCCVRRKNRVKFAFSHFKVFPMLTLAFVVCAYLLGSVSFAVLMSKAFALPDPRTYGSQNPGATNVLRSGKKMAAVLTLLGDAAKGTVAVLLARQYAPENYTLIAAVALAVFLGHLFPIFLRFKGGKGVATALGVLLALNPWLGLASLASWILMALVFRLSSLSALVAAIVTPIYAILFGMQREYLLVATVLSLLLIWRHKANIQNLLAGKESKIGSKK